MAQAAGCPHKEGGNGTVMEQAPQSLPSRALTALTKKVVMEQGPSSWGEPALTAHKEGVDRDLLASTIYGSS